MIKKSHILLGVSSSIAAFKVLELIPLLQKAGFDVSVMMTKHAASMIDPNEFKQATGTSVYVDVFPQSFDYKEVLKTRHVDHIDLADSANLLVLVPATANVLGKLAHGIADDFVTTTTLAVTCPIMVFPSMNVHMWMNPIVQENVKTLKKHGFHVFDPSTGPLACGYEGKGRLPEVSAIAEEIISFLKNKEKLRGKRILVTAGGTEEKIDNVRFITNRSSGKMGVAIADVCFQYGADVTLLTSHSSIEPRYSMNKKVFTSSADLFNLMEEEVKKNDVVFHVAAVSDFSVKQPGEGKLSSKASHTLELIPQKKIVDQIKQWNPQIQLIAFKAEHGLSEEELVKKAKKRQKEASADVIVANDISKSDRGFQSDDNEVTIVFSHGEVKKIPLSPKSIIAQRLVELLFFPY